MTVIMFRRSLAAVRLALASVSVIIMFREYGVFLLPVINQLRYQ